MAKKLTLDDHAAHMAEEMAKSGNGPFLGKGTDAIGDMPAKRSGNNGSNGGFTEDVGAEDLETAVQPSMAKSARTGAQVTSEPGRQGEQPRTGSRMNEEPDGDDGIGGEPGDGANLDQRSGDASTRARKPGHVGQSGRDPEAGSNLDDEDADEKTLRARRGVGDRVGISKAKMDDGEDEDTLEGEESDDEEEMEMGKGGITADDLLKSLDALEGVALGSRIAAAPDRRKVLARKLEAGTLTKSEMAELHTLTKSDVSAEEDTLAKSDAAEADDLDTEDLAKSLLEDPAMKDGFEVSELLERQAQLMAGSLDRLAKSVTGAMTGLEGRQRGFNVQLAKSLKGMALLSRSQGELIKSLADRLDHVENQPVGRRGITTGREGVMRKSMANEVGSGDAPTYTRSDLLDGLEAMSKSLDQVGGMSIQHAMAMLESTGEIPRSALNEVLQFRANGRAGKGMVRVA